jgi:hypothetical protein
MGRLTISLLTVLLLSACGNDDKAWQMAGRDDTPTAYLEFLAKYPESAHASQARARMEDLKEIKAWERAEFKNNEAGYQSFIEKYPESEYVASAETHLAEFQRDAEWVAAQDADSIELVAEFLSRYPDAPQAEEAKELLLTLEKIRAAEEPTERAGDFRVQLAAFRTAKAADIEVRRLVELFPEALLGPVRIETPDKDGGSSMFLLKSVPMTWAEAQATCTTLEKLQQVCLIINK